MFWCWAMYCSSTAAERTALDAASACAKTDSRLSTQPSFASVAVWVMLESATAARLSTACITSSADHLACLVPGVQSTVSNSLRQGASCSCDEWLQTPQASQ